MKAERKTLVWAVLFVEALLVPALIAFAILAMGCNNGTTIYVTGGGGGGGESGITGGTIDAGDEDSEIGSGDSGGDTDNSGDIDDDGDSDGDGNGGDIDDVGDSNDGESDDSNSGDTGIEHGGSENDTHTVIPLFTSTDEISEYLARQTGGSSKDNPIFLNVQIDLGSMYHNSNWPILLAILKEQEKYVELDLSACAMGRMDFAPRGIITDTGKGRIVSIILPTVATSIATGTINSSAFSSFTSLTTVTLPENIVSIGANAFYNRSTLKTVIIHATTPPELGTDAFAKTHATLQIHVPPESVDAYRNAEGWKDLVVVSE